MIGSELEFAAGAAIYTGIALDTGSGFSESDNGLKKLNNACPRNCGQIQFSWVVKYTFVYIRRRMLLNIFISLIGDYRVDSEPPGPHSGTLILKYLLEPFPIFMLAL